MRTISLLFSFFAYDGWIFVVFYVCFSVKCLMVSNYGLWLFVSAILWFDGVVACDGFISYLRLVLNPFGSFNRFERITIDKPCHNSRFKKEIHLCYDFLAKTFFGLRLNHSLLFFLKEVGTHDTGPFQML